MWKQVSHGLIRSRRIFSVATRVTEVRSASISTLLGVSLSKKLEKTKEKYIFAQANSLPHINASKLTQGNCFGSYLA